MLFLYFWTHHSYNINTICPVAKLEYRVISKLLSSNNLIKSSLNYLNIGWSSVRSVQFRYFFLKFFKWLNLYHLFCNIYCSSIYRRRIDLFSIQSISEFYQRNKVIYHSLSSIFWNSSSILTLKSFQVYPNSFLQRIYFDKNLFASSLETILLLII